MGARKNERGLTDQQERFTAEYVKNGGKATEAALKAYPNQSYQSAKVTAHRNLNNANLSKVIKEKFDERELTIDEALDGVIEGLRAVDKDGNKDIDKRLRAHDRWLKLMTLDKNDGLQLNIENAKGIEITFKNFRKDDE